MLAIIKQNNIIIKIKDKLFKNIWNIFFICVVFYEEIIFSLMSFGTFKITVSKILFTLFYAGIVISISRFIKERKAKNFLSVFNIITVCVFLINYIYYAMFNNIMKIYTLAKASTAIQFIDILFKTIIKFWYKELLILLPIVLMIILKQYIKRKVYIIEINGENTIKKITNVVTIILIYLIALLYINLQQNNDINSEKSMYKFNIDNSIQSVNNFGLLTTIRLDFKRNIFHIKDKEYYVYVNENNTSEILEPDQYNMIDINFDKLIENEENEEVKSIHKYVKSKKPTKKNEYTGMFEGKNLILIVAESFSKYAIREDLTPTLYKIANASFKFNNYYTPLFPVSTADGEYVIDTSLFPSEATWTMTDSNQNYWPLSYANSFKRLGYKTYSYHNYNFDYYNRDKYLNGLNYDIYFAKGNGLEKRMDFTNEPTSDCEMVKVTIDDYINEDNFMTFYLTFSGHGYYNHNAMSAKNWDIVKDLPYTENTRQYLAAQIELDKAVEEILKNLEEKGKLDDTVICIVGDHYPYCLSFDEMQSLTDRQLDDTFEMFNMPLIIYNSEVEKCIETDQICYSMDVLPTLLNLFGIKYDSRLLMGNDIFSNEDPKVILSSRSYITTKGRYNSYMEQFTPVVEMSEEEIKEYVKNEKDSIYLKYKNSRLILENNYYKYLEDYFK